MELLLPGTEGGVAEQAGMAVLLFGLALLAVRRSPELRRFIVGVATLTATFFGLRALH